MLKWLRLKRLASMVASMGSASMDVANVKYWATAPTPLSGGTAAIASSSGGIVLVEWICKDTESMTAEK